MGLNGLFYHLSGRPSLAASHPLDGLSVVRRRERRQAAAQPPGWQPRLAVSRSPRLTRPLRAKRVRWPLLLLSTGSQKGWFPHACPFECH